MEFKTWIKELETDAETVSLQTLQITLTRLSLKRRLKGLSTVLTQAQLDVWLDKIHAAELIAFDTETTSLDYMQASLVGVSIAVKPGEAVYIPFERDYLGAPKQLDKDDVFAQLRPI